MAVKTYGPGSFLTKEELAAAMEEQARPMVGGSRTYGDEYDGFYGPRAWTPVRKGMPEPSLDLLPSTRRAVTDAAIERAATSVAKNIVGRVKRQVQERRRMAGLGLGRAGLHDIGGSFLGALGVEKEPPPPETVDVLTAVREIYGTSLSIKPLLSWVGDHPIMTISILMLAIGIGGALGGFIGAGGADILRERWKK